MQIAYLPTQSQNLNISIFIHRTNRLTQWICPPYCSAQAQRETRHKNQTQFNINVNTSLSLNNCIADSTICTSHSCKIHCIWKGHCSFSFLGYFLHCEQENLFLDGLIMLPSTFPLKYHFKEKSNLTGNKITLKYPCNERRDIESLLLPLLLGLQYAPAIEMQSHKGWKE